MKSMFRDLNITFFVIYVKQKNVVLWLRAAGSS